MKNAQPCFLRDDISFSGLTPTIRFERSGTPDKGKDRCDFRMKVTTQ